MAHTALYAFGYKGLTIETFLERLQQARVQLIVDVRELPLSRKKGQPKTPRNHLALWVRLPLIGDPRPDTHIICVESPITVDVATHRVSFDYWTWGSAVKTLTTDLDTVEDHYLGAVVAEF